MSNLFDKLLTAWNEQDVQTYRSFFRDDWEMTYLSTGKVITRADDSPEAEMKEFLKKFITNTNNYLHFDVYSWNNGTNRYIPKGGAAQGIRAIYQLIKELYVNK